QVHNLPHSFFGAGSKQESVYRVGDEIQVADRLQAAQPYRSGCHRLRHNRRYDRARGLTWTEGVEWPDRYDRQTEGGIEALSDLIGSYFRSRIRGLGLKRVFLVNWNVSCRSIDLARGRVHHTPHTRIQGRLKHV